MSGGHKFSILYSYVNNFGNQAFQTVTLNSERKKKQITEILEKYPYYDKPLITRKSDRLDGGLTIGVVPYV